MIKLFILPSSNVIYLNEPIRLYELFSFKDFSELF
jgi:hypothetical protein